MNLFHLETCVTFQMLNAPTPSKGAISSKQKDNSDMVSDAEIQEMLAKLNS